MNDRMKLAASDTQYQVHELASFDTSEHGFTLHFVDGFSFCLRDEEGCGVEPRVGEAVRLYGKGLGYKVRGAMVGGRLYFYRTVAESDADDAKEAAERTARRDAAFERGKDKFEADVNALPEEFRDRMRTFMKRDGWAKEFGDYELAVCKAAAQIAKHCETHDRIESLRSCSCAEQERVVSDLANFTGNMVGAAFMLAGASLHGDKTLLPKIHGALCPLVGCKAYGCWSVRKR